MKTNNLDNNDTHSRIAQFCVECTQKAIAQIEEAKRNVLAEFRDLLDTRGHLLHLAMNEAEALAWQSDYPQLVFADLAVEKAQAVAAWSEHQRDINQGRLPAPRH